MGCKKCGSALPTNSAFCPACGEKVEGKKICPTCKRIVKEEYLFCPTCGERLDGKKYCPTCGELCSDAFCPKCGTNVLKGESKNEWVVESSTPAVAKKFSFKEFEKSFSATMLLLLSFMLFVCSLFMGIKVETTIGSSNFNLINLLKDYKEIAADLPGLSKIPHLVCLIMFIINFFISLAFFVVSAVKYGKGLYKKEDIKIEGYAIFALLFFIITISTVVNIYTSVNQITRMDVLKFNSGAIMPMVYAIITIPTVVVFKQIQQGKQGLALRITKSVVGAVFSILLLVSIIIMNLGFVKMESTYTNGHENIAVGTILSLVVEQAKFGRAATIQATWGYFSYLVVMICLAVALCLVLKGLIDNKDIKSLIITVCVVAICGAISYLLASYNFAFNNSIYERIGQDKTIFYTPGITSVILTSVSAVVAIIYCVLSAMLRKKEYRKSYDV